MKKLKTVLLSIRDSKKLAIFLLRDNTVLDNDAYAA